MHYKAIFCISFQYCQVCNSANWYATQGLHIPVQVSVYSDVGSLEDKQVDITVPKTATEEGEGEDDAEEKEDAPAVVDGTEAASPADVKQRNSELQINVLSRSSESDGQLYKERLMHRLTMATLMVPH